jgi:hypothetical protein
MDIEKELKQMSEQWDGVFNDTTDQLFSVLTHNKTAKCQYEAFKDQFINYYDILKREPKYVLRHLSFYYRYKEARQLIKYAVKDIMDVLNE